MPPGYVPQPGPNGFAIASLVIGIVSLFICGLGSMLAVVFGHIGLARTRRPDAPESGRGLAIGGLVLGYLGIALLVGYIVFLVAVDSDSGPDFESDRTPPTAGSEIPPSVDDDSDRDVPTSVTIPPLPEDDDVGSPSSGDEPADDVVRPAPNPEPPPADMPSDELFVETVFEGDGPPAGLGDAVIVHYIGVLADGTVFDSSWQRNQTFRVTLGQGQVIPGWEEGLVGAREGERRRLVMGADQAYGDVGSPPEIPPNAPLAFTVDVVGIEPAAGAG